MKKFEVEVKASSNSTAFLSKWAHPGRIWVRGYDKDGKRVYETTIGFVDLRYKGPRSRFHRVYREASRWALYLTIKEKRNVEKLLNEFGRACLDNLSEDILWEKVDDGFDEYKDQQKWNISEDEWDCQVTYAYAAMLRKRSTETPR